MPRDFKFLITGKVPDKTCQTKCLSFGEHLSFHVNANSGVTCGPSNIVLGPLGGYNDSILKPDLTEYLPDYVYIQPDVSGLYVLLTAIS